MSYQIIDYSRLSKRDVLKNDPRVAIARHMEWQPNYNYNALVVWHGIEPVNFNHALFGARPLECKFIQDSVIYKDTKTSKWWSVFLVPDNLEERFELWLKEQPIDIHWFASKRTRIRARQGLLYNTKNADINTNERLFQMGYYAKLGSKYFTDTDDTMLLDRLGPIRDCVLDGPEEV